jgi:hypothetical protein
MHKSVRQFARADIELPPGLDKVKEILTDKHKGKQIRIPPYLYGNLMECKTGNESVRDVIQKLIHLYKISKELTG